jgi:hypothetical protein
MPRSFNYFQIENFPAFQLGQQVNTGGQAVFEDYPYRGAHSEIVYLGVSDFQAFTKYKVKHETQKTYRYRIGADEMNTLIAISEFHLFRHTNGYFMADTNRKEIRELADRLGQAYPEELLLLRFRKVDLHSLHENLAKIDTDTSVIGGFFHQLKIDRVSSATIFGHEVGESPLWGEFEMKGELGGLMLNFVFYGEPTSSMITKNGGIVVYAGFGEGLALELVENLNHVIEKHAEDVPVSARRSR